MASQNTNEIDGLMKRLEQNPGFKAYIVLNKNGVVLRWNQEGTSNDLTYEKAIQYSHHVLDLYGKGAENIKDLFDPDDNEVESIRLRTNDYELIAAQEGSYLLVTLYDGKTKDVMEEDTMVNK